VKSFTHDLLSFSPQMERQEATIDGSFVPLSACNSRRIYAALEVNEGTNGGRTQEILVNNCAEIRRVVDLL
jgi:hypothetical protein